MVPGTFGFDAPLRFAYREAHPAVAAWKNLDRNTCIDRIRGAHAVPGGVLDPERCRAIVERDFSRPISPESEQVGQTQPLPSLLKLQNKTAKEFLLMNGEEKKKKGKKGR